MSSSHNAHGQSGHESQDFSFTNLLWLIPASIVMLLLYVGVCMFWFRGAATSEMILKKSVLADTTLKAFRAHENELMHGYTWTDKEKGIVRIPIEQSMAMVVATYSQATVVTPSSSTIKTK
jgi:hypothetical protein